MGETLRRLRWMLDQLDGWWMYSPFHADRFSKMDVECIFCERCWLV